MSLTSKLLSITLLASSFLFATPIEEKVSTFIKTKLKQAGPNIAVKNVKIAKKFLLEGYTGWTLYFVDVKLTVTKKGITKPAQQRYELFSNGKIVSLELLDIKTGESLKALASPKFDAKYYDKANLIAGNENAKHKIVVFSDPLCPFCTRMVPGLIEDAKARPDKLALYLYHFPLSMHPAASVIVKCMVAAELKGYKDIALRTYTVDKGKTIKHRPEDKGVAATFTMMETNEKRVLNEFNKALGTKLTIADINAPKVLNHIRKDKEIQNLMLVNSTPTLYVDNVKDPNRYKYNNIRR